MSIKPTLDSFGAWYRFDRYEITDDYHVRPERGAELTRYDPVKAYQAAVESGGHPPYLDLMDIARRITNVDGHARIDRGTLDLIRAWTNANGLLGILPHSTLSARMPAKPTVDEDGQTRYASETIYRDGAPWKVGNEKADKPLPPIVTRQTVNHRETVSLGEAWGPYFPDVRLEERNTYQYPNIETRRFWQEYAEPLAAFVIYAQILEGAIAALSSVRGNKRVFTALGLLKRPEPEKGLELLPDHYPALNIDLRDYQPGESPSEDEEEAYMRYGFVFEAQRELDWLQQGATRVLTVDSQANYVYQWAAPSLLSMLAITAVDDVLAGQGRIERCASQSCGRYFTATRPNSAYCSATCRKREQMKAYRAKTKKSKAKE